MAAPLFRPEQIERYRRHLSLPELGAEGQLRLLESRVLVIGAGGLGCPLAQYLVAAGVGRIGLLDHDVVALSNLQRQVLYGSADLGRPKVEVARERLRAMNPDVEVSIFYERVSSENALQRLSDWDVVVDGSDNFPTRYLTSDACVLLGKPNVYGAILRFEGQVSSFDARRGPCYRCLFPEPPPPGAVPSCAECGVLGVLPGVIALLQATETLKLLAGIGEPLIGRFLQYDALAMRFDEFHFRKDPDCPACGAHPTLEGLIDYADFCGVRPEAEQPPELSPAQVRELQERQEPFLLLDVREREEVERARIQGAKWIPLGDLESRLGELGTWKDRRVVVYCHHGGRSARACAVLRSAGFTQVANLAGGIEAWSLSVDPSVPRY